MIFINLIVLWILTPPEVNWQWGVGIALAAVLIYQLAIIIPYTSLTAPLQRKPGKLDNHRRLKLLTSNVLQYNDQYHKLLNLINERDPDLVLVMESNLDWEKALAKIEDDYPYTVKEPLDNLYGMHLYSKHKLSNTEVNYLVEDDVPSIYTKVHYRQGAPLNLFCVHPAPPSPTENETSKERDAELLLIGKKVREIDSPVIVCGDLNDVVWSRISRLFAKMTGLMDPRMGRGLYPTFSADHWYLRFPLDHLFHSKDIYVEEMDRLPHIGSDHYPMFFSLWLENGGHANTEPELDEDTEAEIAETIREGQESSKNKNS
ncbi:MAG: endonuclease/exonuclease/phosphatase family protein [Leeuwenhoekiella sp.]